MPVTVKVDEDLPAEISELVRSSGRDAKSVYEQGHAGLADTALRSTIQQEQRLLITADKGFANARDYPPGSHAGVILFRLPRKSRAGYIRLAEFLIAQLDLDDVVGAIVVGSPDAIRVLRA